MKILYCVLILIPLNSFACPTFVSGKYQCELVSGSTPMFDRVLSTNAFNFKQSVKQSVNTFALGAMRATEGDETGLIIDDNTKGKIAFKCFGNKKISWVATHPNGTVLNELNFSPSYSSPTIKAQYADFTLKNKLDRSFIANCNLISKSQSSVSKDKINDYFTKSIARADFFETGDNKDRSRYLDYLISRYLLNDLGAKEKLDTKVYWDLKLSTKSYRSSTIALNVEKIFTHADRFKGNCQSELAIFKQSSAYSTNKKKPEFNKFINTLFSNWFMSKDDIEAYSVNMELYFDMNERIPLANCRVWTDLYKKSLSGIKNGANVVDYDGVIPSCSVFQELKQCSLEFYQAKQERFPKAPKNRVMEYVNTGVW
ncbi:MAG: hypothetical protein KAT25_06155 [Sulfuriflexus sp.]|nr:hypothetical protein [Sulfuriflexus sp.]